MAWVGETWIPAMASAVPGRTGQSRRRGVEVAGGGSEAAAGRPPGLSAHLAIALSALGSRWSSPPVKQLNGKVATKLKG